MLSAASKKEISNVMKYYRRKKYAKLFKTYKDNQGRTIERSLKTVVSEVGLVAVSVDRVSQRVFFLQNSSEIAHNMKTEGDEEHSAEKQLKEVLRAVVIFENVDHLKLDP